MLFDVTLPEPGANVILVRSGNADASQSLVEPPPFTITADQIMEANYVIWAKK
jgi:hypothetical protein